jgi:hypothetical protein
LLKHCEVKLTNEEGGELLIFDKDTMDVDSNEAMFEFYPSVESRKTHVPKLVITKESFAPFAETCVDPAESRILSLCSALWDPIDLASCGVSNLSNIQRDILREGYVKNRFSEWLKMSINSDAEIDISKSLGIEKIFHLLAGRCIAKAVIETIKLKDFRLATLLSQIGGSGSEVAVNHNLKVFSINNAPGRGATDCNFLLEMQQQSKILIENNQIGSISLDKSYLSLYMLLDGVIDKWNETVLQPHFNWLRIFGLFFWYSDGGSLSITESLSRFEKNFSLKHNFHPPYSYPNSKTYDTIFQLLKLFTDKQQSLEAVINPLGYTPILPDVRMGWFLGIMLSDVKNIKPFSDAQSCSNFSTNSNTADRLTFDLIYQLESLGLFKWAFLVSGFISSHSARIIIIKDLLARNYPLSDSTGSWKSIEFSKENDFLTEKSHPESKGHLYKFLTDILKVPKEWIHEARALKAFYVCNFEQQVISLLDAKNYGLAHKVLFSRIIPGLLVSGGTENFKSIGDYLERFPKHSAGAWDDMGGLVLLFINSVDPSSPSIDSTKIELMKRLNGDLASKWIQHCSIDSSDSESIRWITVCIMYMATRMMQVHNNNLVFIFM